MKVKTILMLLTVLVIASYGVAHANLLTYHYTGVPFTDGGSMWAGHNITASVTFNSIVTNNFTGIIADGINGVTSADILHWSMTSGNVTFIGIGSGYFMFTFQDGVIIQWQKTMGYPNNPYFMATINNPSNNLISDWAGDTNSFGYYWMASNHNNPGTWTLEGSSNPTPEPCTMLLLGSGLLGIGGFKFREKLRG